MSRKLTFRVILVGIILFILYRFYTNQPPYTQTHITGQTMGTIQYNIKYLGDDVPNYKTEIDSILIAFNASLSTYISDSEISTLNSTGTLNNPSKMMMDVLVSSQEVFTSTDGAFDPTVGPLVNAWGFGPDKSIQVPDSLEIDHLLGQIGFDKVRFSEDAVVMDSSMYLDFSAIAKGYAVDLVADFLSKKGFEHYLVEIGGEVTASGQNETNETWTIGIEDPMVTQDERRLLAIVQLQNTSMATSGNYRNYYQVGDRTIAHTIDPRSGYNTTHSLLSASVFAVNCMKADAYATAFMVLGLEASIDIVNHSDLEAILIYQDQSGALKSYVSAGLEDFVVTNKTK